MSAPQRFHPQRNSGEIVLPFSATATGKEEVPLFLRNFVFPAFLLKIGRANASLIRIFVFRPKRTPYPSPGADNSWAG